MANPEDQQHFIVMQPEFVQLVAATSEIQDETLYLAEANIDSMESRDMKTLEQKL